MKTVQESIIDGVSVKWLDWAPYAIAEDGRVFSQRKWRWLHLHTKPTGYIVTLITPYEGKAKIRYVHRLVAEVYIPNPESKTDVDHIDNNPSNNHYTNLQWVTHKENINFSFTRDNRKILKGDEHWNYGKKYEDSSKKKMSDAKLGVKHPRFKGWYIYQGLRYPSLSLLAGSLGVYPMKVHRMLEKGLIEFEPVVKPSPPQFR